MDFDLAAKKEFNKLRANWKDTKKELEEVTLIAEKAWGEFYPKFLKLTRELNIKNPFFDSDSSRNKKKDNSIFEEDSLRQKYRQAALLTHPDKIKEIEADSFKKISKAKKEGNLNEFYDEIKKVKIENKSFSYLEIDKIEKEINDSKEKIKNISNSFFFKWYYENKSGRKKIMNLLIIKIKND